MTITRLLQGVLCAWMLASVFQAAAFAIGSFYLPVSVALQLFAALLFAVNLAMQRGLLIGRNMAHPLFWATLLLGYSIFSAVFFPRIFEGLYVLSPSGGIDDEIASPTPLSFSKGNVAQSLYLALNVVTLFAVATIRSEIFGRSLLKWWLISGVVAAAFSVYQKLSFQFGIYYPSDLIFSNQGYSIGNDQAEAGVNRVNAVFTEPSTAGNYFGCLFAFCLFQLVGRWNWMRFTQSVLFAYCTYLTASSIGYLEMIFALGLVGVSSAIGNRLIVVGAALGATAVAGVLLAGELIRSLTLDKVETLSFLNRTTADLMSLQLLLETSFMGAGLGSNRPSSFITYLLSNVGIAGFLLFGLLVWTIARSAKATGELRTQQALLFSLLTLLAGKVLGIPDLNSPSLWSLLAVLICRQASVLKARPTLVSPQCA